MLSPIVTKARQDTDVEFVRPKAVWTEPPANAVTCLATIIDENEQPVAGEVLGWAWPVSNGRHWCFLAYDHAPGHEFVIDGCEQDTTVHVAYVTHMRRQLLYRAEPSMSLSPADSVKVKWTAEW